MPSIASSSVDSAERIDCEEFQRIEGGCFDTDGATSAPTSSITNVAALSQALSAREFQGPHVTCPDGKHRRMKRKQPLAQRHITTAQRLDGHPRSFATVRTRARRASPACHTGGQGSESGGWASPRGSGAEPATSRRLARPRRVPEPSPGHQGLHSVRRWRKSVAYRQQRGRGPNRCEQSPAAFTC